MVNSYTVLIQVLFFLILLAIDGILYYWETWMKTNGIASCTILIQSENKINKNSQIWRQGKQVNLNIFTVQCSLVLVNLHITKSSVLQTTSLARLLPKKIIWEPFRPLKQKVGRPRHISRSPIKKISNLIKHDVNYIWNNWKKIKKK